MNLRSIILTGLLTGVCFAAEQNTLASLVEYQSNQLRSVLDGKKWTITHDGSSIRIESTFEFTTRRRVSPAIGETQSKARYRIDLRFAPLLAREQFLRIAKERAERATIAAYGAPTKEAYSDAIRFLEENPLPRYSVNDKVGKSYSVYFTSTDSATLSFEPSGHYAEARGAEGIVDRQLWPITP